MACIGEGVHLAGTGAGFGDQAAHFHGYQPVILAVDQQDGDPGIANRLQGGTGIQTEMAENQRTQPNEGISQFRRIAHILADFQNNISRGGVGGVGHDAGHIVGVSQFRTHQHGSRAHGNAVDDDGRLSAEAVIGVPDPAVEIFPLPDAEGDGGAAAVPVGPLVDHQGVESQLAAEEMAAGAIPEGGAAVAMAEDHQRRIVSEMIVPRPQGGSIRCSGRHILKGIPRHDARDPEDFFFNSLKLLAHQRFVWIIVLLRVGIEALAVAKIADGQGQGHQKGGNGKQWHGRPPVNFVCFHYYIRPAGKIYMQKVENASCRVLNTNVT